MKLRPDTKVGAGALAGSLSVIIVWMVGEFGDVVVPAEIASAFTVVLTFAVSWIVPEREEPER